MPVDEREVAMCLRLWGRRGAETTDANAWHLFRAYDMKMLDNTKVDINAVFKLNISHSNSLIIHLFAIIMRIINFVLG